MATRIKNYARFQHFKDRSPPWVKLYRDILDDPDWHDLDGKWAKILVMLWLIASEDDTKTGTLPDNRHLCFRLRVTEKELEQAFSKLSHWLEHDDIDLISDGYQLDAPEKRREEAEIERCSPSASMSADEGFVVFWEQYPRKVSKQDAAKAWAKLKPSGELLAAIMAAVSAQKVSPEWLKEDGRFVPHAATWLNGRRWEDESPAPIQMAAVTGQPSIFAGAI